MVGLKGLDVSSARSTRGGVVRVCFRVSEYKKLGWVIREGSQFIIILKRVEVWGFKVYMAPPRAAMQTVGVPNWGGLPPLWRAVRSLNRDPTILGRNGPWVEIPPGDHPHPREGWGCNRGGILPLQVEGQPL